MNQEAAKFILDTTLSKAGLNNWLTFKAPDGNGGIRAMVLVNDKEKASIATQGVTRDGTPVGKPKINVFIK